MDESSKHALRERLRVKTLARFFASAEITADLVNRSTHDPPSGPTPSRSTQLTALAQNAPLRLQCDRAFVSLIDSSTVYVIAEATRTTSLRNPGRCSVPKDDLFLGVRSLDMSYGLCPNSMAVFTGAMSCDGHGPGVAADPGRFVMLDVRESDTFKYKPYVVGFPHVRSFIEVPIKSSDGQIIGTYCCVDNKVREDFFDDETREIMSEVAECITDHLELRARNYDQARGGRLMEGLSEFTKDKSPGLLTVGERKVSKDRRDTSSSTLSDLGMTRSMDSVELSSGAVTPLSAPLDSTDIDVFSIDAPLDSWKQTSPSTTPALGQEAPKGHDDFERPAPSQNNSHRAANIFSRAANLIRRATDLEGLLFLDASFRHAGEDPNRLSEVLGSSVVSAAHALCSGTDPLTLHEDTLEYLVNTYPHGGVFMSDEYGFLPLGNDETGGIRATREQTNHPDELQDLVVKARSLVFLPIWDYSRERFFVGILGWSTDPTRVYGDQDLTCLSAFGVTLLNDVARAEAVDLARSKSTFLSSVSHELRSPLHGILASVELLDEMTENSDQVDLISMIQSCGLTLLDTLNHVLDFSKINEYTGAKSHVRQGSSGALTKPNETAFGTPVTEYLCKLVQEVVEGVHLGQASQNAAFRKTQAALPACEGQIAIAGAGSDGADDIVGVFINTENRADWCMTMYTGAWKRIVMNLFANALKYTKRGRIEVDLKLLRQSPLGVSVGSIARLTVTDTGIGMSEDYVKHHMFKPFMQENPLSNGTGLGLSIVKQIVTDLGGTIDVRSTLGVGTCFDIMVPIPEPVGILDNPPVSGGHLVDPNELLAGRTLCILTESGDFTPRDDKSCLSCDGQREAALQVYVVDIIDDWFGMKAITARTPDDAEADFYLVESSYLKQLQSVPEHAASLASCRLIMVDPVPFSNKRRSKLPSNIARLTYPIAPKQIGKILLGSLQGHNSSSERSRSDYDCKLERISGSSAHVPNVSDLVNNTTTQAIIDVVSVHVPMSNLSLTTEKDDPEHKHHLLLVDDNAVNIKVLSAFVKKLGITAETAENGLVAFEKYQASPKRFTMVLMDISMPVMDGFESSRAIRDYERKNPDKVPQPTRIVALTGLGSDESREEAALSGIDDFRTKPVALKLVKELLGLT